MLDVGLTNFSFQTTIGAHNKNRSDMVTCEQFENASQLSSCSMVADVNTIGCYRPQTEFKVVNRTPDCAYLT